MISEAVLGQFSPLKALSGQFLSCAAKNAQITTVKKGTLIFKRGKALSQQYFLLEGEVDLINNEFGAERVKPGNQRAATALNGEAPTAVSAIAKSTVTYMTLDAALLERLSVQSRSAGTRESDWMGSMLQSPLFYRIPMPRLQELFKKFETVDVKKGERVVKEGAKGDYFYVLAAGTAVVRDRSGSVDLELTPGRYFGEEALISDSPRNASVIMTCDGVVKRLSAEDFSVLLKQPVLRYVDLEELQNAQRPYKILDVRLPLEHRACHFPGSINVPLSRLRKSMVELSGKTVYAVLDSAGTRADTAAYLLCQAGFDAVVLNQAEDLESQRQSA